jgi:Xaa-Pro dipeptidase
MSTRATLSELRSFMHTRAIDAWLIYDFRGSNPILAQMVGDAQGRTGLKRHLTRRCAAIIFADSRPPKLLAQGLDAPGFAGATLLDSTLQQETYLGWSDLHAWLRSTLSGCGRVAMEYSPGCALPVISIVDAGIVELVRSCGVEVVSSADLVQICVARWGKDGLARHMRASELVTKAKDNAFAMIAKAHREARAINEYQVQQAILADFAAFGLETADAPIVAANAHSGDPHFEVSKLSPSPIVPGDWVLIDLWARVPGDHNIFSDITWMGYCGKQVPAEHRKVFDVVRAARDASVALAQNAWRNKQLLQGWQLDDAARNVIVQAGYSHGVKHRTGHSLSPGPKVHGLGFNLDNLETRDTRQVLPDLGFTIEPGIYLPNFGVRLEINMYVDALSGPIFTSCNQHEVVLCAE